MHMFLKVLPILIFLFALTGCRVTMDAVDKQIETIVDKAVWNKNPGACNELPELAERVLPLRLGGGTAPARLRAECFRDYVERTNDIATCKAFHQECTYLAEVYSDPSLCDEAFNAAYAPTSRALCIALAKLDYKECYKIKEITGQDKDKLGDDVANCIVFVVRRTKEYHPCLEINGSEYGTSWQTERNQCLLEAVACPSNDLDIPRKEICNFMVEEGREELNLKQDCLKGVYFGHCRESLPKRLK